MMQEFSYTILEPQQNVKESVDEYNPILSQLMMNPCC